MLVLKNTFVLNISVGCAKSECGTAGRSLPGLKLIFQIYVPARLIYTLLPGLLRALIQCLCSVLQKYCLRLYDCIMLRR